METRDSNDRTYTFDWRAEEQVAASRYLMRHRVRTGPVRWILIAVWAFLLLSIVFAGLLVAAGEFAGALRIGSLTAICGLLLGFLPDLAARIQTRIISRTDPNVAHPVTFEFGEHALRVMLETHASELKWTGVPEVNETDGLILIHYSALAAYYLPVRAVGSDDARRDLLAWIHARVAAPTRTPASPRRSSPGP